METPLSTVFLFQRKGANAKAHQSESGFIVCAGSTATRDVSKAFAKAHGLVRLRNTLIDSGILVDAGSVMRFVKDYEFGSPSTAAAIICGTPINGRLYWKTTEGVSLKDI